MGTARRFIFAVFACTAVSYAVSGAAAQDSPPSPVDSIASGSLVPLASHRVYCECEGSGSPALVLLTGITETFRTWEEVRRELAQMTQVCTYDRAGYGETDPDPLPRSGARACQELQGLLDAVSPETPHILLGHSLGAFYAVLFAKQYPDLVAGMVLMDPPPLDFLRGRRFSNLRVMAEEATGEWERTAEASSQAGQESQAIFFRTIAAEHRAMFSEDALAVERIENLGDLPLVVVAAGRPNPAFGDSAAAFQEFWIESSRSIAALSSQGKLIVAERSGHHVHLEEPDLLLKAVQEMLESLRGGSPVDEN